MIAQMESDYQASRLFWLRSGWLKNVGPPQHEGNRPRQMVRDRGVRARGRRRRSDSRRERLLGRYPVGRFYRNCKGAVIYEGTREIHKLMQADYVLGYRIDRPTRCELPPYGSR